MPRVKHCVLMKFKPSTPPATIAGIMSGLDGLRKEIPGLLDFSGGANSSVEGLARGFTHGFVMTFADEASRDAYLPHPAHERVKQQILAELDGGFEGATIVDWLEKS